MTIAFDDRGRAAAFKTLTMLLMLMAAVSVARGCRSALAPLGSMDLGISLKSAQQLQRENPYERYLSGAASQREAPQERLNPFAAQPVQVPSALMLLWPYSFLSWRWAKLAWLISNLAFSAGLLVLACRRFLPGRPLRVYAAVASLFLMSVTWRNVLGNGQHLLAGLFFLLAAIELADRRRGVLAGIALACALLKYSVIFFLLPYFILKRQWAPLAIAFGVHGVMTAAIALRLGEDPVSLVGQSLRVAEDLRVAGYLDLFALLRGFGAPAAAAPVAALILWAVSLWPAIRGRTADSDLYLAGLCFVSMVIIYHRPYDFIVLLVPLLVAIQRWPVSRLLSALIFLNVLVTWFLHQPVATHTQWLEGRSSAYYNAVALLWYATLAMLLCMSFARNGGMQRPAK
jgi:hypothetical protein